MFSGHADGILETATLAGKRLRRGEYLRGSLSAFLAVGRKDADTPWWEPIDLTYRGAGNERAGNHNEALAVIFTLHSNARCQWFDDELRDESRCLRRIFLSNIN